MKNTLKIIASVLLLLNGIGALYGGLNLMVYPDGSSLHLSLDWLKYSSFQTYFFPGIILFIANGLFSIFVLTALLFNFKSYARLVIIQGAILAAWIIIQIALIQTIYFLHVIFGCIGLILVLLGYFLRENNHKMKDK